MPSGLCAFIFLCVLADGLCRAEAQTPPQYDTTVPNQYEFVYSRYFLSQGGTNAQILVCFYPGNRSFSGSVAYETSDGSAIAYQDYLPTKGTLVFSGNAYLSFAVPVLPQPPGAPQKTVQLSISGAGTSFGKNTAVLTINVPPPPGIKIATAPYGYVTVSWNDDGTEPMLEQLSFPGTNWVVVPRRPYSDGQGGRYLSEPASAPQVVYRLRRDQ